MTSAIARTYRAFIRAANLLNLVLAIVAATVLFGVTMIIFGEVSWRFVGGRSQLWVTEVSEYALLYVTFLAAPYLLQHRRHVTVDLIPAALSAGAAHVLALAVAALGLALCTLLALKGVELVMDQYTIGLRRISVLAPRSWYIVAAFPLGMALMAVQFLDQIVGLLGARRGVA
jgi:TRAP-type C4-dicarboxylate transport system permease small subunit